MRGDIAKAQVILYPSAFIITIGDCSGYASSSSSLPLPSRCCQLHIAFESTDVRRPKGIIMIESLLKATASIMIQSLTDTAFNTCMAPFSPDGEMEVERCVVNFEHPLVGRRMKKAFRKMNFPLFVIIIVLKRASEIDLRNINN